MVTQTQVLAFAFLSCFVLFIECFVKKKIHSWVGRSTLFFHPSVLACFGIARNFFTMFLTHSSSECILCLLYDLFCDEPASVCDKFLLQFLFSELSITSGLFSSKIKPCYNLLKCCSHSAIAIFIFLCIYFNLEINWVNKCQKLLFIRLSWCLIMSSNCPKFCNGNFYVVRNPFAIAFYIPEYGLFVVSFFFFLLQDLFVYFIFPLLTQGNVLML